MIESENAEFVRLLRLNIEAADQVDKLTETLLDIIRWADAYPLSIFPEPDLDRARVLLKEGGITLDSIGAHYMRHVLDGVRKIASEALDKDV